MAFASGDRKIILATNHRSLLVYDMFLNSVLSEFDLEANVVSLDLCEEQGFLATVFEDARDITLWNVHNLHLRHSAPIPAPFVSPFRSLPANPRAFLSLDANSPGAAGAMITEADEGEDASAELLRELEAEANKVLAEHPGLQFSDVPLTKWKPLLHYDSIARRNELDVSKFEETEEVPFFLKFGESLLDTIDQKTKGTLEEAPKPVATKQMPKLEENELIERSGDQVTRILSNVDTKAKPAAKANSAAFSELLELFKGYSAGEVDYFVKKAALFDSQQALKLLAFFEWGFTRNEDFDFKTALFRYFLTVGSLELLR